MAIANKITPTIFHGFIIGKETGPGTILRDFDTLISIINEYKPILSDSGQIPIKMLLDINSRMSRPIKLGLTRPQLMSYPHIEALYILLRSSGLTTITMTGKKKVLAIDSQMFSEWLELNDTERYCTLLEIWLLHSTPIIKHPGSHIDANYIKRFYLKIKKKVSALQVSNPRRTHSLIDRGSFQLHSWNCLVLRKLHMECHNQVRVGVSRV